MERVREMFKKHDAVEIMEKEREYEFKSQNIL